MIKSADFKRQRAPVIAADSLMLQTTRLNDTTLLATLPHHARGQYSLKLNGSEIATIDVAGFISYRARTQTIVGNPFPYPKGGTVSLIAAVERETVGGQTVVQFEPGSGSIRPLLTGYWLNNGAVRSIGPTRNPDVFLLQPVGSDSITPWLDKALEAWDLSAAPKLVASYRGLANYRFLAQINDSMFLHGFHHTVRSNNYPAAFPSIYEGVYEETNEIVLSPRGDRAAIRVHGSQTGPPVFSMITGDTVFHVRSMFGAEGVAFSGSGDTLFVLGYTRTGESVLLQLDATSGAELKRLPLPAWSEDLLVDTEKGVLYLATIAGGTPHGYRGPGVLHLLVIDARTLQLIGDMAPSGQHSYPCSYRSLVAGTDGVFFVCGGDVWRFDRVTRKP